MIGGGYVRYALAHARYKILRSHKFILQDQRSLFGSNFSDLKQLDSMDRFEDHQLSKLKQAWEKNAIAQSLAASQTGRVYFIPTYLCAGLPGPIGTELYLEELKEQLLTPN